MLPGLLSPVVSEATESPLGRPELAAPHPDRVVPFSPKTDRSTAAVIRKAEQSDRSAAQRARREQERKVTWPTADKARLTASRGGTDSASPGDLPVTLRSPGTTSGAASSLDIQVLGQQAARAAGVRGVVLTATARPDGGRAQLDLFYREFASAYGGDWAGRLRIVQLPSCALSTPRKARCRTQTPVRSTNARGTEQLRGKLSFAATPGGETKVLALAAGTKSGGGDYKATPLSASSTWEAGGSSGSFTWSYPLRTPPAAAGPAPDLSIAYDSGSVDGRTANTNNQGSWIGEGFDLTSSFVERKYGSCADDGHDDKFDLCWKYDNASLVLNGKATELVKDDTTGTWRLKGDDASTVRHTTGAKNGDDDGEYWTVITGDGTKYVFGLDKLDGAGADDRTDSVWTVPVFGDDEGELGYSSGDSFAGRDKKQAWRWNLDYVEDTHGNAMTYWYAAEHNNYAKNGKDDPGTDYIRGGYLKEIRYGQRANALFAASPAASDKVTFTVAERCTASGDGCDTLDKDHRDNWPDVPFDAVCKDGDKCTGNVGPSFFTRKRLTGITTHFWNAAASPPAYQAVESWSLTQRYLDPGDTGDSSDQSLWLDEIKHTGKGGSDIALDPVKFSHTWLTNRVDGARDDILSLEKPRVKAITSETGAQTVVDYLPQECVAKTKLPASPDTNTMRCFPVYWSPNGAKDPQLDWFHKYPVSGVRTTDPHGGSEAVAHTYLYDGGGAWHYNDDPMTPAKERTWSVWRGYRKVTDLTGTSDGLRSKTVSAYLRGMDGDRKEDGTSRSVKASGVTAPAIEDRDQYAGFLRESVTYNGDTEVSGVINDPWSKRTATQHKSYADTEAYYVRTAATHERTRITSGVSPVDRVRTTATTYDDYGMATSVEDSGDDAVKGDETCARTWYARNAGSGINSLVSRAQMVAKRCSVATAELDLPRDSGSSGDVVSDTATAYDTTTWTADQKPTKGEVRWTGRAKGYGDSHQPSWQGVETTDYDSLGRPRTVTDALDRTAATITYSPATEGPLTSTTEADAKGYKTSTSVDPASGAPLKVSDPNGKVTESAYDALGRVSKVWLPNRSKVAGDKPNHVYHYSVTSSAPSWVSTGELNGEGGGYNTTYEIFDSLLRSRQVQEPSPTGGRLISQTLYDDRSLAVSAQTDIWDDKAAPAGTLVQTDGGQAPLQTDTGYDAAARPTKTVTKVRGAERWRTTTAYTGDTVLVTAPTGGSGTAEVTNALGQTVERRTYAGPAPSGHDFAAGTYTYTPGGELKTLRGPDDATWRYSYDLLGRQTEADDPDKGTTTTTYDALDRVTATKDAENRTLLYAYDELDRRTGLWQNTKTDSNKLAAWTFDKLAKGQADTSVRYEGGAKGKAYTREVTRYDSLYRPTNSRLVLPGDDPLVTAGVPAELAFSTGYRLDGTIRQSSEPAVGALPEETVSYTYNATGQQLTLKGATGYLLGAAYAPTGELRQLSLGRSPASDAKKLYLNQDYEDGTARLTRSYVTDDVHGYMLQDLRFGQDDAGNVTSIHDGSTLGGTGKSDNQCFTYDGYQRLTHAWTPKSADCATAGRVAADLGGAAPYWTSYTYNAAGQRKTETQHASGGDTSTSYTYGTGAGQPHPLTRTETTKPGGTAATTASYGYDKSGNTTTRPGTQATQSLAWNAEGDLSAATEPKAGAKPATGTGYLYDADGELLIRRATTADGDTVLYLGATEVRLSVKGSARTLSASRYYTAADQTVAVRTATKGVSGSKLCFLAGDHHETSSIAVDAADFSVTKRYTTPFGAPRGETPKSGAWPDDKGFLGKPADTTTGLTHIGARAYDPSIGQFISVDPVLAPDQPQSLNGYSYANQHPATDADPTGLWIDDGTGHSLPRQDDSHGDHNRYSDGWKPDRNGKPWSGGGDPGWRNRSGTASTSSSYPTPAPSPGPPPRPGPYKDTKAGTGLFGFFVTVVKVLGPNVGAWKGCSDFELSSCGSAALDLPAFKPLKAFKYANKLRKGEKRAEESADAGKKALGSCLHSFTAGTDVELAGGEHKAIEDVDVGDEVLATDPETGKTEARPVVDTIITDHDKSFTDLTVSTPEGKASIIATDTHPFWVTDPGHWVDAGDLEAGAKLRTNKGASVEVVAVRHFRKQQRTYDLTVDRVHTYYVLAGATPVLVHNSNCGVGDALKGWQTRYFQMGDQHLRLTKERMQHILERHHPSYRRGPDKATQTNFRKNMSIQDVEGAISSVTQQNRGLISSRGVSDSYQVEGVYGGVTYTMGISNGRIGQFYPH
ncbi:polymorphic toxin-type HINT domain-containing protein [Streptomyces sp. NEAU-Y11]|uniref:polymorphic toxin-type HINT domain-containing protein n=1 Tax=Streptomyces cucumeris TaxID=2962890 RepID=UPI0020C8A457|nr:polymorphic toxin-type HINT domain-containing protein [Streptomyces sp. NEAU-Y11]MCP9205957.1 polymorphic toxin-type HINT domain-containing protein [Streptomyces sp. NEAU-Y11]